MIIVAESGSTKCDWLISHEDSRVLETHTMGFNPFFHQPDEILTHLRGNQDLSQVASKATSVFFYGAGCSSPERNEVILSALVQFFRNAHCEVNHDLNASAFATWDGRPAITCIIGTGSNSCYYDGVSVSEQVPALGYILGDEGSGSYFGKKLVADYLYKRLPKELQGAFFEQYKLQKEEIFHQVYNTNQANVFLASFMRFIVPHKDHPYIGQMVYEGLSKFADIHICCYPNYREVPVHFVGSVAFYFTEILQQVAEEKGFILGKIDKNPGMSLLKYHLAREATLNNTEKA
jgi:N-acetylglucosamine kinase-like BadF-type ATPase